MTNDIMQCPFCELAGPASTWSHHMVSAHGWKKPGEVFTELVHDGGLWWCGTCGDPVPGDDAFVAIIEGRTPEPCDYCGRVLVRMVTDED